jgi:hypothetical protein
VEQVVRLD